MKYIQLLLLLLFILILISLSACNIPILSVNDKSELFGTYIAEYPFAKQTLVIYPNGIFTQDIVIYGKTKIPQKYSDNIEQILKDYEKNGTKKNQSLDTSKIFTDEVIYFDQNQFTKSTGQWTFDSSDHYITFNNYLSVTRIYGDFNKNYNSIPTRWVFTPGRDLSGRIEIEIDPNEYYTFVKVK
jgi:hypothetical protein